MKQIRDRALVKFRYFRLQFIEKNLQLVSKEGDDVEQKISIRTAANRTCINPLCAKTYESMKRKYDACFSKVVRET